MGYLNNQTVTVDAILTKKGRELLSRGRSAFNITQFAVADDEIDYGLYDVAHPLGTEYYGSAIENMPLIEASPDETQNLRYKLVSLTRGQNVIPTLQVQPSAITLTYSTTSNPEAVISVSTSNGLDSTLGYTLVLVDREAAIVTGTGVTGTATTATFTNANFSNNALVVRGFEFRVSPRDVRTYTETQIIIYGNETGATATIPVVINPANG